MIFDEGYFYSYCEHHCVPFFGKYYFSYIPDENIIGLSKIARVVNYYASRLQTQERLVKDIVDKLQKVLNPKGIGLVIKGRHLCKEMRGVKQLNSKMLTSDLRGNFRHETVKSEFLSLIRISKD
jgi:GTP cyclohydrolase I